MSKDLPPSYRKQNLLLELEARTTIKRQVLLPADLPIRTNKIIPALRPLKLSQGYGPTPLYGDTAARYGGDTRLA
jgi:hypothetical protein